MAALGTRDWPINRKDFAAKWLPILEEAQKEPRNTFQKVTPCFVLLPSPAEVATGGEERMQMDMAPEIQAYMARSGTGQTFTEALARARGKALLMNVCTPFLELYPKDEEDCKAIFDMKALSSDECNVPEGNPETLAAFLAHHLVGVKLTHELLAQFMTSLGRVMPYIAGEKLYREETYTPTYELGPDDWVVIDIDPDKNYFKTDADGVPLVRTITGAVFETTYNHAPLGSYVNTIPRKDFAEALLPIMQAKIADPASRYLKVAPTLVLYPPEEELDASGDPKSLMDRGMDYQMPNDMKTLLQTKSGQTFAEAMTKTYGKAILINFCTPFLEVYPKDKKHCAMIYDMAQVDRDVVPDSSLEELTEYIRKAVAVANPLTPYAGLDAARIATSMHEYRKALGRDAIKWRMALNKQDATAVAVKLRREEIARLFAKLGRTLPFNGERLYRAESFDPHYQWGEGDWLLMDIDPATQSFKLDKHNIPLVRTVNETAFECTYNTVLSRR